MKQGCFSSNVVDAVLSLVLCVLLSLATPANANQFEMELPLNLRDRELGMLPVTTDGTQVFAVSAVKLLELLEGYLTTELRNQLMNADEPVTVEQLRTIGLDIELDPRSLELALSFLDADSEAFQPLDLGRGKDIYPTTESANIAALSHFNLYIDGGTERDTAGSLEWLGNANWRGALGTNLSWAAYVRENDQGEQRFYRGNTRLFRDRQEKAQRFSLGDVSSKTSGHLPSVQMGGVMVATEYGTLQPGRRITPTSSEQLVLVERAEVEIYINGSLVRRTFLSAGRYELSDLPLTGGANDIEVLATYSSGRSEVFRFTQFYNSRLLNQGISNYNMGIGYPSTQDNYIEYQGDPVASGFLEHGLSNTLTLGGNFLWTDNGGLAGTTVGWATSFGNFTFRGSGSNDERLDQTGYATSLDFEQKLFGGDFGSPNLRLSAERFEYFQTQPWLEVDATTGTRYQGSYWLKLPYEVNLNLSGGWNDFDADQISKRGDIRFSRNFGSVRVNLGTEYQQDSQYPEGDTRLLLSIDGTWYNYKNRHRTRVTYNSQSELTQAEWGKSSTRLVGDHGYRVLASNTPDQMTQEVRTDYYANRVWVEGVALRSDPANGDDSYNYSARGRTSIAFADGNWGWGNATPGPFSLVTVHPTLGDADVLINPREGTGEAISTGSIPNIVRYSSPYNQQRLSIAVPDAPLGYDIGPAQYEFVPGAVTGHVYQIGSDAVYTVFGTLVDGDGEPIDLRAGRAFGEGLKKSFFTNRAGRFVLEGVAPGEYKLTLSGVKGTATLVVQESEDMLVRAGKVVLEKGDEGLFQMVDAK